MTFRVVSPEEDRRFRRIPWSLMRREQVEDLFASTVDLPTDDREIVLRTVEKGGSVGLGCGCLFGLVSGFAATLFVVVVVGFAL